MFEKIVNNVKTRQDKEFEDQSLFIPEISKFHEDLVQGFKNYVDLAKSKNISGVDYKEIKKLNKIVKEFPFQVDDDFILVMRDEISQIDVEKENIGNLSFIYYDGDPDNKPFIEISIFKNTSNLKFYSVSCFSSQGKKMITGNLELKENAGEQCALYILHFLYRRYRVWNEEASLKEYRLQSSKKAKIGYTLNN